MSIKQDWLMRNIEMMIEILARFIFHDQKVTYELPKQETFSGQQQLCNALEKLLEQKQIGKAEDMLYNNRKENDENYIRIVIWFYQKINNYSDEELEQCNFPRQEIQQGLEDIVKQLQLPIAPLL